MGMYTRLTLWVEIEDDGGAIAVLDYMLGHGAMPEGLEDEHALFRTERWEHMLQGSSYYFTTSQSVLRNDRSAKAWFLTVDCSLKNYDSEIGQFLDWLAPFVSRHCSGFVGLYQYEEDDAPTLLYYRDGSFHRVFTRAPWEGE